MPVVLDLVLPQEEANEQAALKRIYLATLALDPSGRGRKRWNNKWKAALNEFDQLFDGRLTAGRV